MESRATGVDKKELDLLDLLNIWVEKFGERASEEWNALQKNVRALLGKGDFLSEEADSATDSRLYRRPVWLPVTIWRVVFYRFFSLEGL